MSRWLAARAKPHAGGKLLSRSPTENQVSPGAKRRPCRILCQVLIGSFAVLLVSYYPGRYIRFRPLRHPSRGHLLGDVADEFAVWEIDVHHVARFEAVTTDRQPVKAPLNTKGAVGPVAPPTAAVVAHVDTPR